MVRQEAWRRDLPAYDLVNEQYPAIVALNQVLHLLSKRDQDFAISLQAQHSNRPLTEKQLYWVGELTRRGQAAARPQAPVAAPQQAAAPTERAVAFSNLAALFAKAGKHAVVVFRTRSGVDFRLSVAGDRSQNPGHINVTDTSKSFENRTWYGRVTPQGGWVASRRVDAGQLREVEAALAEFNADPDAASAEYGRSTGVCCFCGRELTDERSVSVGRGPVCSERWGLPWGEVPGKLSCEEVRQQVSEADIPF